MNRRSAHPRTAPTHAETTATRATAGISTARVTPGVPTTRATAGQLTARATSGQPTTRATPGQLTARATRRLLSTIAAVTLVAAGCSTDTTPTPGPTTPARAEATVTLPDGAATTSTRRPVDVLADMPAPARERSDAGVEAFVRYFYDSANALAMNPRTGEIAKLCDTSVLVCAQWEKALASYVERGMSLERPIFRVTLTEPSRGAGNDPDGYLVTTVVVAEDQVARPGDGGPPTTSVGRGSTGQVIAVSWRNGHWRITDLFEVS